MVQELEDHVAQVECKINAERDDLLISEGIIKGLQIALRLPLNSPPPNERERGSAMHLRQEIEALLERLDPQ